MALAAAFESGAETIFLISDGNHFIYKAETPEERKKREEDAEKRNGGAEGVAKAREAFEKREAEEAARRAKQGLPPRVREHYGFGITEPPMYTAEDVLEYLKTLYNELYKTQGKKPPRIHCIAFQTSPSEEVFMKAVAHEYRGRFEKITIRDLGVKAIEAR
jgi:hypothetical protein